MASRPGCRHATQASALWIYCCESTPTRGRPRVKASTKKRTAGRKQRLRHCQGFEGKPHTLSAYGLCTAAGACLTTNAARNLTLAEASGRGSGSMTFFFLAFALLVFLMAVAPGGRPAPGRYPPEQPFFPGINSRSQGGQPKRRHSDPKKSSVNPTCPKSGTHSIRCAFENGAGWYLVRRNWMSGWPVRSF